MGIGDQLKELTKNKMAMLGVGAAAVLGLVVLARRSSSGGSGGLAGTTDSGATPYQQPGTYPNTYGTDLASALGNLDSQYAQQLDAFSGQLTSVQSALASLQTSGSAVTVPNTANYNPSYTGTGTTHPTPTNGTGTSFGGGGTTAAALPPVTTPAVPAAGTATPAQPASTVTVPTTTTLPAGYGWFATGGSTYTADSIARRFGISLQTLQKLNPSYNIKSGTTVIGKNLPVRVRSNAAPWDLAAYRKVNNIK